MPPVLSQTIENDVFKFAFVRPPNEMNPADDEKHFITDDRPVDDSEILSFLAETLPAKDPDPVVALRDRRSASSVALFEKIYAFIYQVIKNNGYELRSTDTDNFVKTMFSIPGLIRSNRISYDQDKLLEILETVFDAHIADVAGDPKFLDLKEKLFESLYAFHILSLQKPVNLDNIIEGLRALHFIEFTAKNGVPSSGAEAAIVLDAVPTLPALAFLSQNPDPLLQINDLQSNFIYIGTGDLLVVKQTLQKYVAGEVADIENVLLGEEKTRTHRRLDRTEETLTTDEETTQFQEKDNQTTEKFELKQETEKIIKTDLSLQTGVTVSGDFGPVKLSANANFSLSNSQEESNKNANTYAKEVVDRAVSSIQSKVSTQKTTKTVVEIVETNHHVFKNTAGAGATNITGIYRWVDKHYLAQVFNYGKRPMFEFIIPEPAALYIYSQDSSNQDKTGLSIQPPPNFTLSNKPVDSANGINPINPHDISGTDGTLVGGGTLVANYLELSSRFMASGVTAPPDKEVYTSYAFGQPLKGEGDKDFNIITSSEKTALVIPPGYAAKEMWVSYYASYDQGKEFWTNIAIGKYTFFPTLPAVNPNVDNENRQMSNENGTIPVSILSARENTGTLTVTVRCERTMDHYRDWQLKTFDIIAGAYRTLKADYESQLREAKSESLDQIRGKDPLANRASEKEELKRGCINILLSNLYGTFNDVLPTVPQNQLPEINLQSQARDKDFIQFFEQAFDWEQITYLFYPYFWGRKETWVNKLNYADPDFLFNKFLQAGSARVVVPALNANYAAAIMYYLMTKSTLTATSPLWGGGTTPVLNDPLFKSVVAELKSQQDPFADAIPTSDEWEVVIPTTLVYLQQGPDLPDFTK